MKARAILFLILLISGHYLAGQAPIANRVAYFPFNGNANDMSGNGHNGTVSGATLTADRFGSADSAYFFNGNAAIDCGTGAGLNLNNCSFSVWVKPGNANGTYQIILAKYDVNLAGSYALSLTNNNRVSMWFNTSAGGGAYVEVVGNTVLAAGFWYHIVATHNTTTGVKVYVNGMLDGQSATQFNVKQAVNDHFRIGSQGAFAPVRITNGTIDDIYVYSEALSQSDVYSLYNESDCKQTIYDTVTTHLVVYDTTRTHVTVFDTTRITVHDTLRTTVFDTTHIAVYDTSFFSVADTLVIDIINDLIAPPINWNTAKVYPNPARSSIIIENSNYNIVSAFTYEIKNTVGQVMFTTLVNQPQFTIGISNWAAGVYFLNIYDHQQKLKEVKKIVVP